jgi:hypothetical protein
MYALPFFTERKDKYSAHKGRLFLMSAVATNGESFPNCVQ